MYKQIRLNNLSYEKFALCGKGLFLLSKIRIRCKWKYLVALMRLLLICKFRGGDLRVPCGCNNFAGNCNFSIDFSVHLPYTKMPRRHKSKRKSIYKYLAFLFKQMHFLCFSYTLLSNVDLEFWREIFK